MLRENTYTIAIESVGNQLSFAPAGEIVIQGFHGDFGTGMTFTGIVPINFFFLLSIEMLQNK
jgi:hypothetical protein